MRRIETYELIERYLLGKISKDERAGVEKRMKDDPAFSAEVEKHRILQQVINDNSLIRIKDNLRIIRNQKLIKNLRRKRLYRSMLIAGSCAIILSVSLLLLNKKDSAVRPASEAQRASEAFTGIPDTVNSGNKMLIHSNSHAVKKHREKYMQRTDSNNRSNFKSDLTKKPVADNKYTLRTDSAVSIKSVPPALSDRTSSEQLSTDTAVPASAVPKTLPCNIEAEYLTEPSCNNAPTGLINIMEGSLSGGIPPYQVFLNDKPVDKFMFTKLKPGFYKLEIRDSTGCIFNPGAIVINTIDCNYAQRFSPLLEVWDIPLDQNKPGIIEIFNKNGLLVYKLRFEGTGPETWNGNDLKNSALPRGLYPFTIRYDNGKIFQGTITIIR